MDCAPGQKIWLLQTLSHPYFIPPVAITYFKAAPIVAYRRSSNLSDVQVRAQLRHLTQHNQPQGSYPCGKNCLTYKYISDGQTSYTFHATGETRPITNHIDCNSKNVIYMIQCNHWSKQYTGETKRRLKDRFNEHHRPFDNPSNISKPTTVSEHFLTNDHSANDIILIPLELTKSNRDSVRKGSTKTWNPESGNGNGNGNGIRNPCKKAPSDRFVKKYVSNDNKINKQIKKNE